MDFNGLVLRTETQNALHRTGVENTLGLDQEAKYVLLFLPSLARAQIVVLSDGFKCKIRSWTLIEHA